MPVIDLRSDTVTRPSRAMLEEMMAAPVGDDDLVMILPLMPSSNTRPSFLAKKPPFSYLPALRRTWLHCSAIVSAAKSISPVRARITISTKRVAQRCSAAFSRNPSMPRRMAPCRWTKWQQKSKQTISILPAPVCSSLENTHNGKVLPREYLKRHGNSPGSAILPCTSTARVFF